MLKKCLLLGFLGLSVVSICFAQTNQPAANVAKPTSTPTPTQLPDNAVSQYLQKHASQLCVYANKLYSAGAMINVNNEKRYCRCQQANRCTWNTI